MKAIIHIGTPKTATTTIQYFLTKNRDSLKRQRIFVPSTAYLTGNHIELAAATFMPAIRKSDSQGLWFSYFLKEGFTTVDQDELWKKMSREIKVHCRKDDLVIFSCEAFSDFAEQEVKRVKVLMDSLFDDVTIVLYLRRQPEYLVSLYYTSIIHGETRSALNYLSMPWSYNRSVRHWSIFGKDKITIRLFDKQEFHGNDLLSDFASTCGFDMTGLDRVENQYETMMDSAAIEFLRLLNSHIPRLLDHWTRNPDYHQVSSILSPRLKNSDEKYKAYHLNREEARRILEQCREGNDWIAREYLGREKLFNEDVSMYPEEVTSPHGLTLEKCVEITAHIYKELQAEKLRQCEGFHAEQSRLQNEVARLQEKGILLPHWLGHLITCFMPKKKNRQRFRAKYVKGKKRNLDHEKIMQNTELDEKLPQESNDVIYSASCCTSPQKATEATVHILPCKRTRFHHNKYRLLSSITFGKTRRKYNEKRKTLKALLQPAAETFENGDFDPVAKSVNEAFEKLYNAGATTADGNICVEDITMVNSYKQMPLVVVENFYCQNYNFHPQGNQSYVCVDIGANVGISSLFLARKEFITKIPTVQELVGKREKIGGIFKGLYRTSVENRYCFTKH